jgi:predicted MFS family arabinose efflux permease
VRGYLELVVTINVILVPVIAKQAHFSLNLVGIILAAAGVGNILGAMLSTWLQRFLPFGWGLIVTLCLFVLFWPLYGLVTTPVMVGVVIGCLALVDTIAYLWIANYRLTLVPDHLQGRVNSIVRLVYFSILTLGPSVVGISLQNLGLLPTVGLVWVGFLGLTVLALTNRHLRQAVIPR